MKIGLIITLLLSLIIVKIHSSCTVHVSLSARPGGYFFSNNQNNQIYDILLIQSLLIINNNHNNNQ